MHTSSDPLFERVHALAVGLFEGTLTPEKRQELDTLILTDPAARKAYLEHVQESACLRWLCVEEFPQVVELAIPSHDQWKPANSRRRRFTSIAIGGGLACVLLAIFGNWLFLTRGSN